MAETEDWSRVPMASAPVRWALGKRAKGPGPSDENTLFDFPAEDGVACYFALKLEVQTTWDKLHELRRSGRLLFELATTAPVELAPLGAFEWSKLDSDQRVFNRPDPLSHYTGRLLFASPEGPDQMSQRVVHAASTSNPQRSTWGVDGGEIYLHGRVPFRVVAQGLDALTWSKLNLFYRRAVPA